MPLNRIPITAVILPYGNLKPSEGREAQLNNILHAFKELLMRSNVCDVTGGSNRRVARGSRGTSVARGSKCMYVILVVEQTYPKELFNRGQLLNIGVRHICDVYGLPKSIVFHDIDIVPDVAMFKAYSVAKDAVSLIPRTPLYKQIYPFELRHGAAVFGTTLKAFTKANGYPNTFWGWGGEDNALEARYKKNGIQLVVSNAGSFTSTDAQRTSHQAKMDYLKKEKIRNMLTWEGLQNDKSTWKVNGYDQLLSIHYAIVGDDEQPITSNDGVTIHMIEHIRVTLDTANLSESIQQNKSVKRT